MSKCPTCCTKSTCRDQITPVLDKMGSSRHQSQSVNSPQRRLHPLVTVPTKLDKSTHYNKLLCRSPQEQLPVRGIDKNAVELVQNQQSLGFYNWLFLVPKPNNRLRPILDLSKLNTFLNIVIQNGDTRDDKNLPPGRGVGDLHRFKVVFSINPFY